MAAMDGDSSVQARPRFGARFARTSADESADSVSDRDAACRRVRTLRRVFVWLLGLSSLAAAADSSVSIAIRFDKTSVFFAPGGTGAAFDWNAARQKHTVLGAPVAAHNPGAIVVPDPEFVMKRGELFGGARVGEEWELEVAAGRRVRVVVKQPVVADGGCSQEAGFLAEVVADRRAEFAASQSQYFLIHRLSTSGGPKPGPVGELSDWKATPGIRADIERMLRTRVKDEVAKVHAEALPEYERLSRGEFRTWAGRWQQIDARLARGEGTLSYDMRAFRLTPDGAPRVFVRARWKMDDKPVFFLSLWLRVQSGITVEAVSSRESGCLRSPETGSDSWDIDVLGTVLNVLDGETDGFGDLLIYGPAYESGGIDLVKYTGSGPARTAISLDWGC